MKFVKIISGFFLVVLLLLVAFQFIINAKYSFPEPVAFNGQMLYNPYQEMDSTKWNRANFHLHTELMFGLTAGAANSNQVADSFYKYFDYDINSISDYMRINTSNRNKKVFIPVYEHGYQYYKVHQLVINAKKVHWIDYVFRQTIQNKQFIIDRLKKDSSTLVTIVHPKYRNGYTASDFKYLGNYDCLEISNSKNLFINYYDSVLSAGHAVFLMADDDAHDLADIEDAAHSFNVINGDLEKNSIIHALRTGNSYGVKLNIGQCKTNPEKKAVMQMLPVLKEMKVVNDSLLVRMNKQVGAIKFIGQNGILKKTSVNCNQGSYKFNNDDTYIRTEIVCSDGSVYYLNPVFRYDRTQLVPGKPQVNVLKTWIYRIAFIFMLFVIILLFIKYSEISLAGRIRKSYVYQIYNRFIS